MGIAQDGRDARQPGWRCGSDACYNQLADASALDLLRTGSYASNLVLLPFLASKPVLDVRTFFQITGWPCAWLLPIVCDYDEAKQDGTV